MPRLALVGNLSRDVVDGGPPRIGGGAFYAARAWRALGARATIFTRCGPDERADYARRLISVGAKPEWIRAVREHVEIEDAERAAFFGEGLPVGLKLVD